MSEPKYLVWLPVLLVFAGEHLIMTRCYGKPSSLQRLFRRSNSAKADICSWFFSYFVWPYAYFALSLLTLPGLGYFLTDWAFRHTAWQGTLGLLHVKNVPLAWIVALIVVDFINYVSHVLMHKIPFFWKFHKIHHSATEMTIATGIRNSISEVVFNDFMKFLLFSALLGLPEPPTVFAVLFVYRLIDMIQHSDLPWDYGPLDYVVASPRFHRLHHSSEIEDHDANYANILSFWDYLFGTVARRYRKSRQVADTCVLGLADGQETEEINTAWYTTLFRATLLHPVYDAAKHQYKKRKVAITPPS